MHPHARTTQPHRAADLSVAHTCMQVKMVFLERTLAIVKPDASDKANEILDIAQQAGFNVISVCSIATS